VNEPKVRRVMLASDHDNQRWVVLEGYIDGCPAVTKRDTINVAALASGDIVLADRVAKMKADVAEYHGRWLTLQSLEGVEL
jgi:hypothetical protein